MARPPDADSAETADRILRATSALLEEKGLAGVSLRGVARRAELSVGTLTYYYPNKEALVEACLDHLHEMHSALIGEGVEALAAGDSLATVGQRIVRTLYRAHIENREALRLRMLSIYELDGLPEHRFRDVLEPALAMAAAQLSRETGMPEVRARLTARTVIFMVARFAVIPPAELLMMTGCDTLEDAERETEEHLVRVAGMLLSAENAHPERGKK